MPCPITYLIPYGKVPIVTLVIGEGGSGGALGIGMGNRIGMLSGAYFGVISPEGAASILGRYKNDAEKAVQFPLDCQALATAQCIYAYQLKEIGVIDEIIWESAEANESYSNFPILCSRIRHFVSTSLLDLQAMTPEVVVSSRFEKFRALGSFSLLDEAGRAAAIATAKEKCGPPRKSTKRDMTGGKLLKFIAEQTVSGSYSRYRNLTPPGCPEVAPSIPHEALREFKAKKTYPTGWTTAKKALDAGGPEALVDFVKSQVCAPSLSFPEALSQSLYFNIIYID